METPNKEPAPGYFKIPLHAAREIVAASDGPQVLAGYMVLREGAYGEGRRLTACGAKSIAKYSGCTDWRSKRVMDDLRSLCFGDRGEWWFIRDSRTMMKNAPVYALGDWPGSHAYLPELFVKPKNALPAPLHQFCNSEGDAETMRDALLLLLHLYACTDYGGWMGAPPDSFIYQRWDTVGQRDTGDIQFELGQQATIGGLSLWMVSPPVDDQWMLSAQLHAHLFVEGVNADLERIWRALRFLLRSGTVCKVAVVGDGSRNYPLWVFNRNYRSSLAVRHGLRADLAKQMHSLAVDIGADADNALITAATDPSRETDGTGIYYCAANSQPVVRTLLVPRLHAPTPNNIDGLKEIAGITSLWTATISKMRTKAKAA